MALTKAGSSPQDWKAVDQNTVVESAEFDVSDSYNPGITIQASLDTTTAHEGTEFIILVTGKGSGNEDWAEYETASIGLELVGTALTENLTDDPLAAGEVTLAMADTAGFETYGAGGLNLGEIPGWRFIEDGVDIEDPELIYQISFVEDTSITFADPTANEHAQNTPLYNIAISKTIDLPDWVRRAKVIVHNAYDVDGSTLVYRVLGGKVTAV